jgi:hypothetical protein
MSTQSTGPASASREAGELYLLFNLQHDRYALSVHEVVEVLPLRRLKAFPQAPAWVAGGFDYHGTLVPVIDLLMRASERPAAQLTSTRLVLVHYRPANRVLGLILEKATDTWEPCRTVRKGWCNASRLAGCCLRMCAHCYSRRLATAHDQPGRASAETADRPGS